MEERIFKAFRLNYAKLRMQDNEKIVEVLENANKSLENFNIKDRLFGKQENSFSDIATEFHDLEDANTLIKSFYVSICDISFNEYSVFHWDCRPTSENTAKARLDAQILNDTTKMYNVWQEMCKDDHKAFLKGLEKDIE
eukprot:CAMPEP_0114599442 /NCGR_PEP_ID=MMETSP0125-20121206/21988_1 /TAXON_ID=485358 ORGANISM="Aristerostoma sp., Strain ATCC 50986" /NCGR_SAMPLE_ID=MMETSP0125 /ASSEMBLY_ACC=CAM_ASM_000245 /LENGTH=138 /DNA_ID=CAMNT_0001806529 /DNA_START=1288 /DNA_END=1704 /DNA_ORIENTATION=+